MGGETLICSFAIPLSFAERERAKDRQSALADCCCLIHRVGLAVDACLALNS